MTWEPYYGEKMDLKPGERIVFRRDGFAPVVREITRRRKTGYSWKYPDTPEAGEFRSEDSNDPFFFLWERCP